MVNIRINGDKVLLELTEKFDKVKLSSFVIDIIVIDEFYLDKEIKDVIDLVYDNIYKFYKVQFNLEFFKVEICKGVVCFRYVRFIVKVRNYCYI